MILDDDGIGSAGSPPTGQRRSMLWQQSLPLLPIDPHYVLGPRNNSCFYDCLITPCDATESTLIPSSVSSSFRCAAWRAAPVTPMSCSPARELRGQRATFAAPPKPFFLDDLDHWNRRLGEMRILLPQSSSEHEVADHQDALSPNRDTRAPKHGETFIFRGFMKLIPHYRGEEQGILIS